MHWHSGTGTKHDRCHVPNPGTLLFCVLRIFINLATVLSLRGIIQVVARVDGLV